MSFCSYLAGKWVCRSRLSTGLSCSAGFLLPLAPSGYSERKWFRLSLRLERLCYKKQEDLVAVSLTFALGQADHVPIYEDYPYADLHFYPQGSSFRIDLTGDASGNAIARPVTQN